MQCAAFLLARTERIKAEDENGVKRILRAAGGKH